MGDLVGKIGGVTEIELNKVSITTLKQRQGCKMVIPFQRFETKACLLFPGTDSTGPLVKVGHRSILEKQRVNHE